MHVREVEHQGHDAIEIVEHGLKLVIVHDIGPRIAWFGRSRNLLFWDGEQKHCRGPWRLYGGHRLWLTRPGADESEETYAPDNERCSIRRTKQAIAITAPVGALAIERALIIRPTRDGFAIAHRLRNLGDMLWSGGAWALTCTQPERRTRYRIPLGGGPSAWEATTFVIPTRWGGEHTSRLDDPQFELEPNALVVRPGGFEAKRMISAPSGILEMRDGRGVFRKHAAYVAGATYPLATNVALYIGPDNFMVEMETMSPLHTLAPGQSLLHVESWALA